MNNHSYWCTKSQSKTWKFPSLTLHMVKCSLTHSLRHLACPRSSCLLNMYQRNTESSCVLVHAQSFVIFQQRVSFQEKGVLSTQWPEPQHWYGSCSFSFLSLHDGGWVLQQNSHEKPLINPVGSTVSGRTNAKCHLDQAALILFSVIQNEGLLLNKQFVYDKITCSALIFCSERERD